MPRCSSSNPVESDKFWPYAEAAAVDGVQHRRRDYDDREREEDDWPACWGKCQAGKCILNQDVDYYPGCCRVQHRHAYGSSSAESQADDLVEASVQAGEEAMRAGSTGPGLYCWKVPE